MNNKKTENVFCIGPQVFGESFIGRREEIKFYQDWFFESSKRTGGISLVGLARSGKSSLINNAFFKINRDASHAIYIYMDLKEMSGESYYSMWFSVVHKIENVLLKKKIFDEATDYYISKFLKLEEASEYSWPRFMNSLKGVFEVLSESEIKVLLVFDEFDEAQSIFQSETSYYELLRTLFTAYKYNMLYPILISRRELHVIEGSTYRSSTLHGAVDSRYLKGFNSTDMHLYYEKLLQYDIDLNSEQKNKIAYYVGNSAYLLSIIGHRLVEAKLTGKEIDIDEIFYNSCHKVNDYYRSLIKYLEADGNLRKIIPFVLGPRIGVNGMDKEELINLGYLKNQGECFVAISEYFCQFLHWTTVDVSIWDNIINVEKKIKLMLEAEKLNVLQAMKAVGSSKKDIERNILQKAGVNSKDISRYEVFIYNNNKEHMIDSSFFDVMSLGTAVKIISANWGNVFSKYFNNDLWKDWEYKFAGCVKARNPVAHGHEEYLSDNDKVLIDGYCKLIFEALSQCNISVTYSDKDLLDNAAVFAKSISVDTECRARLNKGDVIILENVSKEANGSLNGTYKGNQIFIHSKYVTQSEEYYQNNNVRSEVLYYNDAKSSYTCKLLI